MAPTGRDSELLKRVLEENGVAVWLCQSVPQACAAAEEGAAGLLLAEEALSGEDLLALRETIERQPEWSDLPVLMLVAGGIETLEGRRRAQDRAAVRLENLTLLERPIRIGTLISTVKTALRARMRQYEIRQGLAERVVAEEAMRRSEKLAVAGRLAASIAHEINNPLESVTNLLYLIARSDSMEEVRMFTATAEQELARVSEIVTQTLRFHRQQTKAVDASLTEIFESVLALHGGRISGTGVQVRREFRGDDRMYVLAGEIRQLVANLVQNALDAMPHGGTLRLRVSPVERRWRGGPAGVRMVVADSGVGIPLRIRKTLFEPFVTTKGATGTGLGLWVSKEIVEKHGGEFQFRSAVGERVHGTVFSIFLPNAGGKKLEGMEEVLQAAD